MRWVQNRLTGQAEKVVLSDTKSNWRPVTSGVPLGSIMEPILFCIFVNDVDDKAKYTPRNLAGDIKLEGVADTPEGRAAVYRALTKSVIKFNKYKCEVLNLRRNNPRHQNILHANHLESHFVGIDMRILWIRS